MILHYQVVKITNNKTTSQEPMEKILRHFMVMRIYPVQTNILQEASISLDLKETFLQTIQVALEPMILEASLILE